MLVTEKTSENVDISAVELETIEDCVLPGTTTVPIVSDPAGASVYGVANVPPVTVVYMTALAAGTVDCIMVGSAVLMPSELLVSAVDVDITPDVLSELMVVLSTALELLDISVVEASAESSAELKVSELVTAKDVDIALDVLSEEITVVEASMELLGTFASEVEEAIELIVEPTVFELVVNDTKVSEEVSETTSIDELSATELLVMLESDDSTLELEESIDVSVEATAVVWLCSVEVAETELCSAEMIEVRLGILEAGELSILDVIGSTEVIADEESEELETIAAELVALELVSVTESELITFDDDDVSINEAAVLSLDTDELGICIADASVRVAEEGLTTESLEAFVVADESIAVDDDTGEVVSTSELDWVLMILKSEDGSRVVVEEDISDKPVLD